MKECKSCNAALEEDQMTCPSCGTMQEESTTEGMDSDKSDDMPADDEKDEEVDGDDEEGEEDEDEEKDEM
jgi:DNA-directed RNA polymerase subunit M/transcription elongation factor TFIIS